MEVLKIKINKDNINNEDIAFATSILNQIRNGKRVFGNVSLGLKKTLKTLDKKMIDNKSDDPTVFQITNSEVLGQISKTKAGITGENMLGEYLEKIIKYNKKLDGIIIFASLSKDNGKNDDLDYILDTDFLAVYGKSILIMDAKNIVTNPEVPLYIEDNILRTMSKEIMELHPSKFIWEKIFKENKIEFNITDGCVVICNKKGSLIWKNKDWYSSTVRPVHISELQLFLEEWISKQKDNIVSLKLLTEISKTQIRKEKSDIDFGTALKRFKI